jgi:hypothetical protein
MGDLCQAERDYAPLEQAGRIRPSTREGLQFSFGNADIASDMSHLVVTAARKFLPRSIARPPVLPPSFELAKQASSRSCDLLHYDLLDSLFSGEAR